MAEEDVEAGGLDAGRDGSGGSGVEGVKLDPILLAFLEMELRRLRRVRRSRVPRRSLIGYVNPAIQNLIMFMLLANLFHFSSSQLGLQQYIGIPIAVSIALVIPTLAQTISTPEHTFTAWVSTEVYVFCLWTAWLFQDFDANNTNVCIQFGHVCVQKQLIWAAVVFVGVFCLTCFIYALQFLSMSCTAYMRCSMLSWHAVRRVPARPGLTRFSYKPAGFLGWTRAEFTYCGATDEDGRPHGHGMWCDTSFHGECLRGQWVHGRPAGPFTSRESGSGAQFLQRAVGYATSRGDCPPWRIGASSMLPYKLDSLRYGQAQVEVSFAGGFFPFLPSVEQHSKEESLAKLVRCLVPPEAGNQAKWRHTVKLEVLNEGDMAALDHGVASEQLVHLPVQLFEAEHVGYVTPEALAEFPDLVLPQRDEALVFIHGYNCDLITALGRVAQVFALGNMPPHVVPFVFSYSAGGPLQYFSAKTHMAHYGGDFTAFLEELARHFQEVHILTHSCGAEFFFTNWPSIARCFLPARRARGAQACRRGPLRWVPQGRREGSEDLRLHLATLTLMNPDVLVEKVMELLPDVMRSAEHFTTYNDESDGALFWAGWLQTLVPRWYQQRPWSKAPTAVFGRTLKSLWLERMGPGGGEQDCEIRLEGDLLRASDRNSFSRSSSDFEGTSWPSGPHVPGDGSIDIINCSSIDQNVHNLRHNYFMLNTQMVEDVCELIGGRLPAPYRQRLCQVNANIFNFLSPPGHLKE